MKHVTYAEKSLLVGGEAADLLIEYAALIGPLHRSDVVTLNAIGSDGNDVEVSFLLNGATNLVVETASTTATEPNNHLAMGYMLERIQDLKYPFAGISDEDPSSD